MEYFRSADNHVYSSSFVLQNVFSIKSNVETHIYILEMYPYDYIMMTQYWAKTTLVNSLEPVTSHSVMDFSQHWFRKWLLRSSPNGNSTGNTHKSIYHNAFKICSFNIKAMYIPKGGQWTSIHMVESKCSAVVHDHRDPEIERTCETEAY